MDEIAIGDLLRVKHDDESVVYVVAGADAAHEMENGHFLRRSARIEVGERD